MDFIFENIYWLVIAAAGIVQWWKSTQEAKEEARRNAHDYDPDELEEFLEEAERAHPRPAVPPPLPQAAPVPAPALRRSAEPPPLEFNPYEGVSGELERQAKLAEQVKQLKQAKRQRSMEEVPTSTSKRKRSVESTGSLRSRLNNRRELKQAFVLKEILEKPIGLR